MPPRGARLQQAYVEVNSEEEDFARQIATLGDGDRSFCQEDDSESVHEVDLAGSHHGYLQPTMPSQLPQGSTDYAPSQHYYHTQGYQNHSEPQRRIVARSQQPLPYRPAMPQAGMQQPAPRNQPAVPYIQRPAPPQQQTALSLHPADLSQRIQQEIPARRPNHQLSHEDRLAQALQDTQFQVQEKDDRIKSLEAELAQTKIEGSNLKKSVAEAKKKQRSDNGTQEQPNQVNVISPEDQRIGEAARKYLLLDQAFIEHEQFLQPNPNVPIYVAERYDNYQTKLDGAITEMYLQVPPDLHKRLAKDPDARGVFTEAYYNLRRALILKIRSDLGHRVWGGNAADYAAKNFAQRDDNPVFRARIYNPRKGGEFSKAAPMFFPDDNYDPDDMFKTKELAMLLRGLLFGKTALDNPDSRPPATSQGRKVGIKTLTPGLLALNATLAIFANSGDEHFAAEGKETKIPYQSTFDSLKKILIIKNLEKKEVMDSILRFYLPIVFAGLKSTQTAAAKNVSSAADTDDESSGIEDCVGPSQTSKGKGKQIAPLTNWQDDGRSQIRGTKEPPARGHPAQFASEALATRAAGAGPSRSHTVRFLEPETTNSPLAQPTLEHNFVATSSVAQSLGPRPGILKQTNVHGGGVSKEQARGVNEQSLEQHSGPIDSERPQVQHTDDEPEHDNPQYTGLKSHHPPSKQISQISDTPNPAPGEVDNPEQVMPKKKSGNTKKPKAAATKKPKAAAAKKAPSTAKITRSSKKNLDIPPPVDIPLDLDPVNNPRENTSNADGEGGHKTGGDLGGRGGQKGLGIQAGNGGGTPSKAKGRSRAKGAASLAANNRLSPESEEE